MPDDTPRFDVHSELGRGASGPVRRLFDRNLQRFVADKRLDFPQNQVRESVQRFEQEARVSGQLEHPNIVPVHDFGRAPDGTYYLHMKLVEGVTLKEMVQADGPARLHPSRLAEYVGIFVKVCDALAFAHSRGVVHRDLKPPNVMVGRFGEVYLVDWGVAKFLRTGQGGIEGVTSLDDPEAVYGTPAYMSPEQVAAPAEADERTDVFGLGATLWHVLTGHKVYEGPRIRVYMQVMQARVPPAHEAVTDGVVPVALSRIVEKAMSRDPRQRYQTITELRGELEDFLRGTWRLQTERFSAGSLIVREGDPGNVAFVLLDGRVAAYTVVDGQRRVLREMGPGDVFGEMAIFTDQRRSSSVEALTDVHVQVVSREALLEGTGLNTWIGRFVTAVANRFLDAERQLLALKPDR